MAKGQKGAAAVPAVVQKGAMMGMPNAPAYLEQYKGKGSGLQQMDSGDFIIPRIKILQDPKREPATFEKAKIGEFWLNVLDQPLGKILDFVVCSNRKRVLLLRPMDDKSGSSILARADDGVHWQPPDGEWQVKIKNVKNPVTWKTAATVRESGLLEFGTSIPDDPDSNPAATLFYEYLVYLPEFPSCSPCVLSLARTAAKRARDLNGKLEFGGQPIQSRVMRATITKEGDGDQSYFNYAFTYNGYCTEDVFDHCRALGLQYGQYRAADEEGAVSEEASQPRERGEI